MSISIARKLLGYVVNALPEKRAVVRGRPAAVPAVQMDRLQAIARAQLRRGSMRSISGIWPMRRHAVARGSPDGCGSRSVFNRVLQPPQGRMRSSRIESGAHSFRFAGFSSRQMESSDSQSPQVPIALLPLTNHCSRTPVQIDKVRGQGCRRHSDTPPIKSGHESYGAA